MSEKTRKHSARAGDNVIAKLRVMAKANGEDFTNTVKECTVTRFYVGDAVFDDERDAWRSLAKKHMTTALSTFMHYTDISDAADSIFENADTIQHCLDMYAGKSTKEAVHAPAKIEPRYKPCDCDPGDGVCTEFCASGTEVPMPNDPSPARAWAADDRDGGVALRDVLCECLGVDTDTRYGTSTIDLAIEVRDAL